VTHTICLLLLFLHYALSPITTTAATPATTTTITTPPPTTITPTTRTITTSTTTTSTTTTTTLQYALLKNDITPVERGGGEWTMIEKYLANTKQGYKLKLLDAFTVDR